ncbi:MAG: hypothetical protein E7671_03350 [Ruminococcaceae bacterium]|nr:hypothetical protein [Oscillospiraceae bacterium]
MSYKTFRDYNEKHGVAVGFQTSPTEYLNMIKQDLGLSMPIHVLSYLQNHYRLTERRDPLVEEIIMLDILWANANTRAHKKKEFLLAELITDDKDIKDTFADLMHKMRALHPLREGPISFESLFHVAGAYLSSILPGAILAPADNTEKNYTGEGPYIFIPECGDELLKELRKGADFSFSARYTEHNIIEEITEENGSAELFLPIPLPAFATFNGGLLISIKEKFTEKLCAFIAEKGYTPQIVGKKRKKGKLSLASPFLSAPVCIEPSLICELTNIKSSEIVSVDMTGTSARDYYDRGITAVTNTVRDALESGIEKKDIIIKNTVKLPKNESPALTLAFILGLYRAQIELGVCDIDSVFEMTDEVNKPEISVTFISNKAVNPTQESKNDIEN